MEQYDFLRINLPYGIKRNSKDEWIAFNRDYYPVGWAKTSPNESIYGDDAFAQYPIYHKFIGLTENSILDIIKNPKLITRDSNGKIYFVFFYEEATPQYLNEYFDIIREFSKFAISI